MKIERRTLTQGLALKILNKPIDFSCPNKQIEARPTGSNIFVIKEPKKIIKKLCGHLLERFSSLFL